LIASAGKRLKWLQAARCQTKLTAYLKDKGLADAGYCGLTTTLGRHIETHWRSDNDAFAQRVWGAPWTEIFADDIGREFTPNDFAMCKPDEFTERRLQHAICEMTPIAEQALLDPALAVEAPWNDLLGRGGWTPRG
jgi:hypothetical protein